MMLDRSEQIKDMKNEIKRQLPRRYMSKFPEEEVRLPLEKYDHHRSGNQDQETESDATLTKVETEEATLDKASKTPKTIKVTLD